MRQLIGILIALAVWGCSDPGSDDPTPAGAAPQPVQDAAQSPASRPEWLPEALRLPADAEIVAERSFGRSTRLLQVRTGADREALLAGYLTALGEAGYETRRIDARVLFEGHGVEEGSVGFADTLDQGPLLQIDLMLATR